ncbi:hypothetical protein L0F37_26320, partial [Klebsiella pneumoniae]|nr:hypothetical protein [Klebsiella pneumoniae]
GACVEQDDKGWDARKRAYCLKIQPATGSFARNLIYSTKPAYGAKNLCMHHDMGHHVHMAARDISASGQHAQCGKDYQIYARPVPRP